MGKGLIGSEDGFLEEMERASSRSEGSSSMRFGSALPICWNWETVDTKLEEGLAYLAITRDNVKRRATKALLVKCRVLALCGSSASHERRAPWMGK